MLISPSLALTDASLTEAQALRKQIQMLERSIAKLTSTVEAQQQRIAALERDQSPPALAVSEGSRPAAGQSASPSSISAPSRSLRSSQFLPDIGVVADIVGSLTESSEDEEGNDRWSAREVELVLGHDIDPYARLDATITFSDFEDPELEEAYVSYFGLPYEIKGRIGRMRQKIGKASAIHPDSLDTVDEPLVVARYLGVEGLFRSGVESAAFAPWSTDNYTQELVLGMMEGGVGEDGELFGETRRAPSYYARLANFFEMSDASSLELGAGYLLGSQDDDTSPEVHALQGDVTFIHRPSSVQRVKLQGEIFLQNRDERSLVGEEEELLFEHNPLGMYALADYRFSERWGTGFRYDYVEPSLEEELTRSAEQAYSGYLTFFQSEFARWRFQYQHALLLDGDEDNRFFLQGTFAIGTHKHNIN